MNIDAIESEAQLVSSVSPDEPRMKQLVIWDEFREQAEKFKITAETLTVTNVTQVAEMKLARVTRLAIKELRVAITHKHRELKAGILEEGRKIDAGKNELLKVLEPLEERLLLQETFAERETKRIADALRESRTKELASYITPGASLLIDLATLTDTQYSALLRDSIQVHEVKLAREAAEKIAAFEAAEKEKARLEAQRIENERLKKEAAERNAEIKAAEIERARLTKQLEDERRAAQAKVDAELARVRAEKAATAAKEKAVRDAIELQARKDREAAEAVAKAEREARQKIEKEIADRKAAEEKVKQEALLAPDRDKLMRLATDLRLFSWPKMSTEKGVVAINRIVHNADEFAAYIEQQAKELI